MSAQLIDGKAVAASVLEEVRAGVAELGTRGIQPGLAVVLVGDDPASHVYVGSKERTCKDLGFHSVKHELPAATTLAALLALVEVLNLDPLVHGILVQSPLPKHLDEAAVVAAIDPRKDVDGLHALNVAKLATDDPSGFVPCTPMGCVRLLQSIGIPIPGARVVVLGRSMLVGKPVALLLMRKGESADATVTVAHSRTRDLATVTREADILIAAIGKPEFVRAEHVKAGAVVIDVGVNRVEDASAKRGYRLTGDVAFNEVREKASWITPVPGGVGPMTIAMLMSNTLRACRMLM